MTESDAKIFRLKVGDRNLALCISNVRNDVKLPSSRCFMLCISAAYTSPPALHFSDKVHEALSALARGHGRNQWPALTWRNQNPFLGEEFLFFFLDLTLVTLVTHASICVPTHTPNHPMTLRWCLSMPTSHAVVKTRGFRSAWRCCFFPGRW